MLSIANASGKLFSRRVRYARATAAALAIYTMARPNYSGEKRRKELEKQKKKEEKKRRKLENASPATTEESAPEAGEQATVPSPS